MSDSLNKLLSTYNKPMYSIQIRMTDDGHDLDGYYDREEDVSEDVYRMFKLLVARVEELEYTIKQKAEPEDIAKAGWRSCIDHIIKPESTCPVCEIERLNNVLAQNGLPFTDPDRKNYISR